MTNQFGKTSELKITVKSNHGITVLEDVYFTAPYKVAKPFYNIETGLMSIMIMVASAGIMEGDCYSILAKLGAGARVALLGQSYNKIHRMKEGYASQTNRFYLEEGAFLDYVQKPTIPFGKSDFHSFTECHLKKGASFLYSDVLACGRVKRGELFEFKAYKNCVKVFLEDELIFMDHQQLVPKSHRLNGIGFFEGYTHQAMLAYFSEHIENSIMERMHALLESVVGIEFGLTNLHKYGMLVRILGSSSDSLERCLAKLRSVVENCRGFDKHLKTNV